MIVYGNPHVKNYFNCYGNHFHDEISFIKEIFDQSWNKFFVKKNHKEEHWTVVIKHIQYVSQIKCKHLIMKVLITEKVWFTLRGHTT